MAVIFGPSKSHSSYIGNAALGTAYQCGRVICKNGGIGWIVAPSCSEVSRTWYLRGDAVTTALACTAGTGAGATGWFVPTISQLQNPGYLCRTYWDSYSTTLYWSSSSNYANYACSVPFTSGTAYGLGKTNSVCVRAFRCVTY